MKNFRTARKARQGTSLLLFYPSKGFHRRAYFYIFVTIRGPIVRKVALLLFARNIHTRFLAGISFSLRSTAKGPALNPDPLFFFPANNRP
jgi:hypothetical protein